MTRKLSLEEEVVRSIHNELATDYYNSKPHLGWDWAVSITEPYIDDRVQELRSYYRKVLVP